MNGYKSAKDLLAQFPQRMAEGGQVTIEPMSAPVVDPRGTPASLPEGTAAFAPVQSRPRQLIPFNQLPVSPTALSSSQQFARDRAAQDELLRSTYAQTGAVPLSRAEYFELQQRMRAGELNAGNLREKLVLPTFQRRVEEAYKAIGRPIDGKLMNAIGNALPGEPGDNAKKTREEFNSYYNKLSSGEIAPGDFQKVFLTAAATPPTYSANAAQQLLSVNKARAALNMDPLTVKDLAGYVAPRPVFSYNFFGSTGRSASPSFGGGAMASLGRLALRKAATPAAPPPAPIDFNQRPTSTQLFAQGGAVKKLIEGEETPDEEAATTLSKKELLDLLIERQALQDIISEMPSVRLDPTAFAGTFENKDVKGGVVSKFTKSKK